MAFALSWPQHPWHLAVTLVLFAVHLLLVVRAITRPNRIPASRVAWVAVIMFLPLLGIAAYLMLGETSIGSRRIRRLRVSEKQLRPPAGMACTRDASKPGASLFDLAQSINGFAPVDGNRIVLLGDRESTPQTPERDCEAAIAALVADIEQACEHVHVGFYIWLDDGNGGRVADALCAAARRGVRCRVMVDALGSRAFIRSPRWKQLRAAGVRAHAMLDDVPRFGHLAAGRVDLRNHRKLAVIDNRIAHCGSQNCADPEFRVKPRFAPWIDMQFRCEGSVVRQVQWLFLATWVAETGERGLQSLAAEEPAPVCYDPGAVALMFGTGPTSRGNAMSDMFVACLYAARRELLITTPYFVPDEAMLRALCAAPRRGVTTTILFPARNDSWLVDKACRSAYAELLESGVAVREYPLGLLHSKSMTIDGELALVGSANMDRRSLELNFENNLLIADGGVVATIRARQAAYLSVSLAVTMDDVRAWSFVERLAQNTVGMMSPVL